MAEKQKPILLTGKERFFENDEIIVSKTDLKGRITYCNRIFLNLAGYTQSELLNQPHSIIRHPAMPRCIFKFLWDTISQGTEVFAYVINRAKNGDHYWVFAHVTPSFDNNGQIIGYHSNRRVPDRRVVDDVITPLYQTLLAKEGEFSNRKDGMNASFNLLVDVIKSKGMEYDELIFSL